MVTLTCWWPLTSMVRHFCMKLLGCKFGMAARLTGYGNVCSRDSVQISHSFSVFRKSNFLDRQLSQFQVQEWPLKYVVDFLFLGPIFLGLYNYNMIYFNLLYDCWILTSLNLKDAFFSTVDVIVWRPVPAACSALPWQCWMPPRRTCPCQVLSLSLLQI